MNILFYSIFGYVTYENVASDAQVCLKKKRWSKIGSRTDSIDIWVCFFSWICTIYFYVLLCFYAFLCLYYLFLLCLL